MSGDHPSGRRGPVRAFSKRGLAVLAVTGVVGVGLAIYGYGRGVVLRGPGALASAGGSLPRSSSSSRAATTSSSTSPQSTTPASPKLGPLLSSTQYAPYAFRVYPGPESSQTVQATTGFKVDVTP